MEHTGSEGSQGRDRAEPEGTATISAEPRPRLLGPAHELISVLLAGATTVLAIVYTVTALLPVLVAWGVSALVYLTLVFTVFRNRAMRNAPASARALPRRVLEYLSWTLPLAAGATGITAAVTLLSVDGADSGTSDGRVTGLFGSIGVVVAWLMLQAGFAEIYESVYQRLPEADMITFPGKDNNPTLSDFLYLSFTVGTSFAVSDAAIASRKVRRVILIQSITSYFYNAFLIAIAIRVLQAIIENG